MDNAHKTALAQMDPIYRRPVKQSVLNQKEDRDFKQKLDMLDKQFRYTQKMLKQRRDSLIQEQRKVVIVKVCEPKATVNIAMKEIDEHMSVEPQFRGIHTSHGSRLLRNKGCELVDQSRSISAPLTSIHFTNSVRHRGNIQSNLSLMQMKYIATIDSISKKEWARQQQKVQEEMERMRQLQRETLHKRVTAFIESLKNKNMCNSRKGT